MSSMNQIVTTGIILSRTDFGEADRIITVLTPDQGKLRLMAKGVRRSKSKLAGGIELFSVSDITFIKGRGDIGTLISTRLKTYYGNIVKNIDRTMLGYELIKLLDKITEEEPGDDYFELLEIAFKSLDSANLNSDVISFWFYAQILRLAGRSPNLQTDTHGQKLEADQTYLFSFHDMAFAARANSTYTANHIKLLRLAFLGNISPVSLQKVDSSIQYIPTCLSLAKNLLKQII